MGGKSSAAWRLQYEGYVYTRLLLIIQLKSKELQFSSIYRQHMIITITETVILAIALSSLIRQYKYTQPNPK